MHRNYWGLTMKKIIDIVGKTVTFKFDGLHSDIVLHVDKMSDATREYAILAGMGHRCGDMAANMKTEDARHAAVKAGVDHYESGTSDWNMRAAAASAPDRNMVAMAAKLGITYEELLAKVAKEFLADIG